VYPAAPRAAVVAWRFPGSRRLTGLWHYRCVTSSRLDHLARIAYNAHRSSHPTSLPSWEDISEQEHAAWRAAVSAVAGQPGVTVAEPAPRQSLHIQVGNDRRVFHNDFTVGRQGNLVIDDEYASGQHARFRVAHGLWYVEDLGSTNGTWLNGRQIHAPQLLKKSDKVRIGHTFMIVVPS
jgi:pSer/pThr/pTyr-binding forkhead associated (FHA) protein